MAPPKFLHQIPEVMDAIGIGRTKVYELAEEGELQFVHIGRRALVTDESLRAYVDRLASRTVASARKSDGEVA